MAYNIQKLKDINPTLCTQLQNYCYDLVGFCMTVHNDMGPFLNEYMYQDALKIVLDENNVPHEKEYYFSIDFHGQRISHKHYVDFLVRDKVYIECKAIEHIGPDQRQQLWNYMRLTNIRIGILYNFAPIISQCEKYYFDPETQTIFAF